MSSDILVLGRMSMVATCSFFWLADVSANDTDADAAWIDKERWSALCAILVRFGLCTTSSGSAVRDFSPPAS
jgi:hypothetical protein